MAATTSTSSSSLGTRSSALATRFVTACALVGALSSPALAGDSANAPHFAQPPVAPHEVAPHEVAPHEVAPHVVVAPPHEMREPDDDLVAPVLSRDSVRAALLEARHRNLDSFRAYQKAGVFPSNTYQPNQLNVWRDADGHFCAAATIIRMSGLTELVDRVADQNNFIRLADVSQGPLMDFILTSGFTQEEIVAIQAPFARVSMPVAPQLVDSRLRTAENARLRAKYKVVERMLVKNEKRDIELATDRLMKHTQLAWTIASAE